MSHWRDGGIGNMPGSDDRPIKEWTLLEKLKAMSECTTDTAFIDAAETAKEALELIERYEKVLTIISGSTDLLIATQAAGALTNIGAKV